MNASKPEIWGGVECTVNRVRDHYFDQLERSGHAARQTDLSLFATLGIKCLRQPLLWERVAPEGIPDWTWSDNWFAEMRGLQLRPIVGLLHHGSGPRFTGLLDPEFPEKFAAYAHSCAERYPWIDAYTPINEPLTTARFSGLYGLWYPHSSNKAEFVRMLLNQIRGSVLAMREIRKVNPEAKFISTEDLGKISSTPPLKYQADFENERRWLTVDLLAGHVHSRHPIYPYLVDAAGKQAVSWFEQNPLPPDIVGLNYYVTSERFLDHRLEHYPLHTHGGNDRHAYADVETVRVADTELTGAFKLLEEAWQRYQLPLAVTECHISCTPEEQVRWFSEIFNAAQQAREQGIDVRAVTTWALLGSYNWRNLLTRDENHYEAGAFDLRGPVQRPTAVAELVKRICAGESLHQPVLDTPGWWRRDSRFQYGTLAVKAQGYTTRNNRLARRILLIGDNNLLTQVFARASQRRGLPLECIDERRIDFSNTRDLRTLLNFLKPWAVINTTRFSSTIQTANASALYSPAQREVVLAEGCKAAGIALATFSSDQVFDGEKGAAYVESDPPHPSNEPGRLCYIAEQSVQIAYPKSIIVRTEPLFGTVGDTHFTNDILNGLTSGNENFISDDSICSPTYIPDLITATLDLLVDDASGIWHLANRSAVTRPDFVCAVAKRLHADNSLIRTTSSNLTSNKSFSLISERGGLMPNLEDAISRFISENGDRLLLNLA